MTERHEIWYMKWAMHDAIKTIEFETGERNLEDVRILEPIREALVKAKEALALIEKANEVAVTLGRELYGCEWDEPPEDE